MKPSIKEQLTAYKKEHAIRVARKGWGEPEVSVWITGKDPFEGKGILNLLLSEGSVIWNVECVSDRMWTPGMYDIYQICLGEPDLYQSRAEAEEKQFASCRKEYLAVRREIPGPEPEKYEQLLEDIRPHLSFKNFDRLLAELEGKTSEEKEEIIRETMDELTTAMSYY